MINDILEKKIFKNTTALSLIAFFTISSCSSYVVRKHKPCFLTQADVLFQTSTGETYTNTYGFKKYNNNVKNHYETVLFYNGEDHLNYIHSVSDNIYVFVLLEYSSTVDGYSILRIYDKDFNFIKDISLGNVSATFGIECSDNFVYFSVRKKDATCELIRYDVLSDMTTTVVDRIDPTKTYSDNHIKLFIDNRCCVHKKDTITKLAHEYENGSGDWLLTDRIRLSLNSTNEIVIKVDGNILSFKNVYGFNAYYPKAYLIENVLLFATYKYVENKECLFSSDCMCARKESFLFSYSLSEQKIELINKYNAGSFLIDYSLNDVEYYYEGGLYLNDSLIKDCELVKPGEVEELGLFDEIRYSDAIIDYYLAFSNGSFYGIQ